MRVIAANIQGSEFEIDDIAELTFMQSTGAACDALLLSFNGERNLGELYTIRLYHNDKLIFFGYCDNQKKKITKQGITNSIYARSSACLLVDNKSQPYTYLAPTSRQLYITYAKDKGFFYALPDLGCNDKYEVSMGCTCFGAINNFVSLLTGSQIYVDAENTIRLRRESKDIKRLDSFEVISFCESINRSEPLSQLNFKDTISREYTLHTRMSISDKLLIDRQEYVNLAALPVWQRDHTIERKLRSSYDEYKTAEVQVKGFCDCELGQCFTLNGSANDNGCYILREKHYSSGKNGEITKLLLSRKIDTGGFTYVA